MVPVPWTDALEVVPREGGPGQNTSGIHQVVELGNLRLHLGGIQIPGDAKKNLCFDVFRSLGEWYSLPKTDLYLIKDIPTGAGLGGGSADAAACLRGLKELYDLRVSDVEARTLLGKLGSDCPFFWDNQPALVHGKGDLLRSIDLDLSGKWVVMIYPNLAISTPEAYAGVAPKAPALDLQLLSDLPITTWKDAVVNDFEESLFPKYPVLSELKSSLYGLGAVYASLSGSGSTVYGIFDQSPTLPTAWHEQFRIKTGTW